MRIDFSPLRELRKIDFYLLRHGKSEGNRRDIVQGLLDSPLSNEGREQAILTGGFLVDRGIRFTRCTPLSRGKETADLVCREANLAPPRELPELTEMDTGAYTGLTLDEARKKSPQEWTHFLEQSWDGVEGAESSRDLLRRSRQVWQKLIAEAAEIATEAPESPEMPFGVLAVAHAGILQWLIKSVSGEKSWFPLFPMGHCGIYHLSVDGTVIRWEKLNLQAPGVTGKR